MIVQPQSPPRPKTTLRAVLTQEWEHWSALPASTLCWLLFPSAIVLVLSPLVLPVAYLLQLWAGSSWTWRDRWASVKLWAGQGSWLTGWLCLLALLADAHVWFFPALLALAQSAWRAHLPGELALLPLLRTTLLARTLLLLPLAPVLALFYERIDPRKQMDLHRVLTPSDLVRPAAPPVPPAPEPAPTTQQVADPSTSANAAPAPQKKKARARTTAAKTTATTAADAEQLTIDSFLAPEQATASAKKPKTEPTPRSSRTTTRKKKQQPEERATDAAIPVTQQEIVPTPSPPETINWDDVAE